VSCRGHTLVELLISVALISALTGSAALLTATARNDDRVAQRGETDLQRVRRASDLLAEEVRGASSIEHVGDALVTDGISWTAADGALCRDGISVVSGIARLDVENSAPLLWTVSVAPASRRTDIEAPALRTTIRRRVEMTR